MFWMWFWFGLAVAFLIIEVLTADLVCVWFGAAALVSGVILAIFPALPIGWQFVIFVLLSAALLAATRPLVKRLLKQPSQRDTNLDRLIGRTAEVTERIDNLAASGAVRVGGLVWTARAFVESETFEVGDYVIFEKIEGNKALVKRKGD